MTDLPGLLHRQAHLSGSRFITATGRLCCGFLLLLRDLWAQGEEGQLPAPPHRPREKVESGKALGRCLRGPTTKL